MLSSPNSTSLSGPVAGRRLTRLFAFLVVVTAVSSLVAQDVRIPEAAAGAIPLMNAGGTYLESRFASFDFERMVLEEQNKAEQSKRQNEQLVKSGLVSALDLQAPLGAVRQFDAGVALLKQGKSEKAATYLEKAIKQYSRFVSAHNDLGVAYNDLGKIEPARTEFVSATTLDPKFPSAYINLGRLELSQNNFEAAAKALNTATSVQPANAGNLTLLAYAQYGSHKYKEAIETADRTHGLDHKGMANVHYIAAASAIPMQDYATVRRELERFVQEDPTNPLAPVAKQNLEILARNNINATGSDASGINLGPAVTAAAGTSSAAPVNLANSERLRNELAGLSSEGDDDKCADCDASPTTNQPGDQPASSAADRDARGYTFRKNVDEVGIFFAATSHGHTVTDLKISDIKVLDAGRAPEKFLQFVPQSKLPLHLALLIDTSGSVKDRFSFEKRAAIDFVNKMISKNAGDLAFVAGFANTASVSQDFTSDMDKVASGVNSLGNQGGTALFDAVSFACWKLAAYPERDRVANVLVVLTDGEDNSSHNSLKQALRDADTTGVTIYTISTTEHIRPQTDADKVLVAMAERSGGSALFPGDILSLRQSFGKLHDLIRSRYFVAYTPPDFVSDGKYHPITIIAEKDGHHLQVRTRKGYFARKAVSTQH